MVSLLQSSAGESLHHAMRLSTIYRLSSTQAKKLLISNYELVIAVPFPLECRNEPGIDAKRVFGLSMPDHYQHCRSAEFIALPVMIPGMCEGDQLTRGTQGVLGRILHNSQLGESHPRPVIWVDCAVGHFIPPSPRYKPAPAGVYSWPGKVLHRGKDLEITSLFPRLGDDPSGPSRADASIG